MNPGPMPEWRLLLRLGRHRAMSLQVLFMRSAAHHLQSRQARRPLWGRSFAAPVAGQARQCQQRRPQTDVPFYTAKRVRSIYIRPCTQMFGRRQGALAAQHSHTKCSLKEVTSPPFDLIINAVK